MCKNTLFARIKTFLEQEGIEYCKALEFSRCSVINQRRMPEFDVKSAVVFLMPYKTGDYPHRNVSLYSVSRDYHLYAKMLAEKLNAAFSEDGKGFYLTADSSPVDERAAAVECGLGVMGENGLVINEKYGSYVFVGTILTDAVFEEGEYAPKTDIKKVCLGCGRCKEACGYLRGDGGVCLSELTQKKTLDENELAAVRSNRIRWGCDTCQQVCPMNKEVHNTPIPFFHEAVLPWVSVQIIENMTDEEFESRAYSWRGKKVILRNLSDE